MPKILPFIVVFTALTATVPTDTSECKIKLYKPGAKPPESQPKTTSNSQLLGRNLAETGPVVLDNSAVSAQERKAFDEGIDIRPLKQTETIPTEAQPVQTEGQPAQTAQPANPEQPVQPVQPAQVSTQPQGETQVDTVVEKTNQDVVTASSKVGNVLGQVVDNVKDVTEGAEQIIEQPAVKKEYPADAEVLIDISCSFETPLEKSHFEKSIKCKGAVQNFQILYISKNATESETKIHFGESLSDKNEHEAPNQSYTFVEAQSQITPEIDEETCTFKINFAAVALAVGWVFGFVF